MTPPGRRRALPAKGTATGPPSSPFGTCAGCSAPILWLTCLSSDPERNGRLAPIDRLPIDGGNIEVDEAARTYRVVAVPNDPVDEPPSLFDQLDADAAPAPPAPRHDLHLNHWVTCTSPTYRRLARERAAGKTGPLVVRDTGEPVHRRPR